MKKLVLFLTLIPYIGSSQIKINAETGIYFKEHTETAYSKINIGIVLAEWDNLSISTHSGIGIELLPMKNNLLIPLFTEIEGNELILRLGGEFLNGNWCSMLTAGIKYKQIVLNAGTRIGDFNELVILFQYRIK